MDTDGWAKIIIWSFVIWYIFAFTKNILKDFNIIKSKKKNDEKTIAGDNSPKHR